MLTLMEELYLLSVHEEKGTLIPAAEERLAPALSAALLAELALQGKINAEEKHRLDVVDKEPVGDPVLDKALDELASQEHLRKVTYWLRFFTTRPKKLRKQIGERCVEKGFLAQVDSNWLWVQPSPDHPNVEATQKYWIKTRLRELVLACGQADLHELALLSLVKSGGLLFLVFTKDERKLAEQRIYEMMIAKALVDPTAQSLEEIATAVRDLIASN